MNIKTDSRAISILYSFFKPKKGHKLWFGVYKKITIPFITSSHDFIKQVLMIQKEKKYVTQKNC